MLICTLHTKQWKWPRDKLEVSVQSKCCFLTWRCFFSVYKCFALEHILSFNGILIHERCLIDDSKQVQGTTGIRTRALLRGEKYETESQSLKENIFLICLMICSWDMLYFRAGNSRCLAPVVRAIVLMSEPMIWKVIRRKLVNSTKASKMKIQKIVFLLKTRLKEMRLGSKPWENWAGI